jgi:hypothetical protein
VTPPAVACPRASVICVAPSTAVPAVVATNVTVAPATGLPKRSRTSTVGPMGRAPPALTLCSLPPCTVAVAAAPAVPTMVKVTGVVPAAVAVMTLAPAVCPSVKPVTVAMPCALVVCVPPLSCPPPLVTLNVTATLGTGLPAASRTTTDGSSVPASTVPTVALATLVDARSMRAGLPAFAVAVNTTGFAGHARAEHLRLERLPPGRRAEEPRPDRRDAAGVRGGLTAADAAAAAQGGELDGRTRHRIAARVHHGHRRTRRDGSADQGGLIVTGRLAYLSRRTRGDGGGERERREVRHRCGQRLDAGARPERPGRRRFAVGVGGVDGRRDRAPAARRGEGDGDAGERAPVGRRHADRDRGAHRATSLPGDGQLSGGQQLRRVLGSLELSQAAASTTSDPTASIGTRIRPGMGRMRIS